MANIPNNALPTITDGSGMTAAIFNQILKVIQAAVNDNDQILQDLNIGSFAPATFAGLLQTSTTFNQLKNGYVHAVTDPINTTVNNHETRIAALEAMVNTSTGTLDGGTF